MSHALTVRDMFRYYLFIFIVGPLSVVITSSSSAPGCAKGKYYSSAVYACIDCPLNASLTCQSEYYDDRKRCNVSCVVNLTPTGPLPPPLPTATPPPPPPPTPPPTPSVVNTDDTKQPSSETTSRGTTTSDTRKGKPNDTRKQNGDNDKLLVAIGVTAIGVVAIGIILRECLLRRFGKRPTYAGCQLVVQRRENRGTNTSDPLVEQSTV